MQNKGALTTGRKKSGWNMKGKMAVAVSLIVAVPLVILAILALEYLERQLRDAISLQQLTMVRAMAEQIDDKLAGAQKELTLVGKECTADLVTNRLKAQQFLDSRLDTQHVFDNGILILSSAGELIAVSPRQDDVIGGDLSFRSYFRETVSTRQPVISDAVVSIQKHHPAIIMFTSPIFNGRGEVAGIFAGSIDLSKDNFLGKIPKIRLGKKGHVHLFVSSGGDLFHPREGEDLPGGGKVNERKGELEGTIVTGGTEGGEVLRAFRMLRTKGWVLAADMPKDEAYASIYHARRMLLGALLVVIGGAMAAGNFLMRRLTAPLALFADHVRGMTGKMELIPFATGRRDEIGILVEAFNEMVAEREAQRTELEQAVAAAEKAQAKTEAIVAAIADGITIQDTDYRIIYQNGKIREMIGDHVGEQCYRAYHGLDQVCEECAVAHCFSDGMVHQGEAWVKVGGRDLVVEKTASPLRDENGTIIAAVEVVRDVTARRTAEKVIGEQRQLLKNLLENCAVPAFVLDREHRVLLWNRACERLTGVSGAEVIGTMDAWRGFYESRRPVLADFVISNGNEKAADFYASFAGTELVSEGMQAEGWFADLNGQERYIVFNAAPVKDGSGEVVAAIETLEDITWRRRSEEELRKQKTLLQNVLSTIPHAVFWKDRDSVYQGCNDTFVKMAGENSPADVVGRTDFDLPWKREESELFVRCDREVMETRKPQLEVERSLLKPDGTAAQVLASKVPLYGSDGQVIGVLGIFIDVTEHNRLEQQLRHAQKMEAIGTLAGGVAHDFNNILTAIIGYSNLLGMRLGDDEQARYFTSQILAAAERASSLTQSMLTYSRKKELVMAPVDLNDVVGFVSKFLVRLIGEDVELVMHLTPQSIVIRGDRGQLEQVLMNLATNARDAMPDGGTLRISTGLIDMNPEFVEAVGFGMPGRYAVLSVSDSGTGMEREALERIFEPFYTTKEVGKGTGLGLSIIYGIVKQHNGYIHAESEPGHGTTFSIYLPLEGALVEEQAKAPVSLPGGGTETILLVEDNDGVRRLLEEVLQGYGYKVMSAVDGVEGVELFRNNRNKIDLVILDVVMPRKNGREALDEIRGIAPEVKAIFMSGYAGDILTRQGVLDSSLAFIAKPIAPGELLVRVRDVLDGGARGG